MGQRSVFDSLDENIKAAVHQLIKRGQTIDTIAARLNEWLDADAPSRSATGRYVKNARAQMERYKESQQFAAVWAEKANENPDSDIGQMNLQLLTMIANTTLGTLADQPEVDLNHIALMATALRNLASASKTHTERHLKVEDALKRRQLEQLQKIESETPAQVDPAALLKRIREEVYGIAA